MMQTYRKVMIGLFIMWESLAIAGFITTLFIGLTDLVIWSLLFVFLGSTSLQAAGLAEKELREQATKG
jgi:hypothetical protein